MIRPFCLHRERKWVLTSDRSEVVCARCGKHICDYPRITGRVRITQKDGAVEIRCEEER